MGLAKAAELNGYPGPLHVLALAKELRLTSGQMRQVTDIRERMSAAAKPLGGEIIDREQELDGLFAQGQITADRLSAETAAIGALQGRLRSVHLAAHLETRDVPTPSSLPAIGSCVVTAIKPSRRITILRDELAINNSRQGERVIAGRLLKLPPLRHPVKGRHGP
jgi:hypothetical protein